MILSELNPSRFWDCIYLVLLFTQMGFFGCAGWELWLWINRVKFRAGD
jgi:hypothetical protein